MVAGELREDSNTSEIVARVPEILTYLSKTISVQPRDGILTGTPAGPATEYTENPPWLMPGQIVRVEAERLGSIENMIVAG